MNNNKKGKKKKQKYSHQFLIDRSFDLPTRFSATLMSLQLNYVLIR